MSQASAVNRIVIQVDRELCFGFGDCVDSVPEVFALDEQQKAIVLDPDGVARDEILDAAQNCPVDAIVIFDEHGEQIFP